MGINIISIYKASTHALSFEIWNIYETTNVKGYTVRILEDQRIPRYGSGLYSIQSDA
jgi:hypothetical protein